MTRSNPLVFPDIIYLDQYGGDFDAYFNAVYQIFYEDFIKSHPVYNGLRVTAQSHPDVDGIHRTFYHITHEGEIEDNRIPDIRRMEKIKYPKCMIENCPHAELLVWKNVRGTDTRILIYNDAERYLTILTERRGYYLFWTAYPVERERQRNKLLKEYKAYKNAETAQ